MRRNKLYGLDKSDTMGFRTYHIEVKAILQYVHEMVTPVHEASFKDTSTTGSVTTLPLPLLPRLFRPSCRRRDENPGKVCWPLTVNAACPPAPFATAASPGFIYMESLARYSDPTQARLLHTKWRATEGGNNLSYDAKSKEEKEGS